MFVVTEDRQIIEDGGCLTGKKVIAAVVLDGDQEALDALIGVRIIENVAPRQLHSFLLAGLHK